MAARERESASTDDGGERGLRPLQPVMRTETFVAEAHMKPLGSSAKGIAYFLLDIMWLIGV